jgi:outer membrane biosynthesis protein TonB
MTNAEMHAFEKAMMDDPMLNDAVDGYRNAKADTKIQLQSITEQLKAAPVKIVKGSFKQWLSIAAVLVMLLSASVVLYRIFYTESSSKNQAVVATDKEKTEQPSTPQTETKVDSTTVAINQPTVDKPTLPKPVIIPPAAASGKTASEQISKNEEMAVTTDKPSVLSPKPSVAAKDQTESKEAAINEDVVQKQKSEPMKYNKFIGRVVDENNNPLPFANITEKTSGVGTYTDVNGNFVLLSSDSVLNVQTKSLGFINSNTLLKKNSVQKIMLNDDAVVANAPTKETLYDRYKKRMDNVNSDTTDEVIAAPLDGWSNYNLYVYNNMREKTIETETKNRRQSSSREVLLSFDVNPDGTLSNFKVERSNCKSCNNEAIRLLREGPRWKSKSGKKENSRFTVRF